MKSCGLNGHFFSCILENFHFTFIWLLKNFTLHVQLLQACKHYGSCILSLLQPGSPSMKWQRWKFYSELVLLVRWFIVLTGQHHDLAPCMLADVKHTLSLSVCIWGHELKRTSSLSSSSFTALTSWDFFFFISLFYPWILSPLNILLIGSISVVFEGYIDNSESLPRISTLINCIVIVIKSVLGRLMCCVSVCQDGIHMVDNLLWKCWTSTNPGLPSTLVQQCSKLTEK